MQAFVETSASSVSVFRTARQASFAAMSRSGTYQTIEEMEFTSVAASNMPLGQVGADGDQGNI
jgi:hypothetical protein